MDLYKVLKVRRGASRDEVKAAFRKVALQFHPDRHSQASKQEQELAAHRFREASDAYQILGDPVKRAVYDRNGHESTFAGYDARKSNSSSSASPPPPHENQWHYRRSHYYTSARQHYPFWSFRMNLSPLDIAFHAVFAGTIIVGLVYGALIGELMWDRRNSGKSFEDIVHSKQKRIKDHTDDDRIQ